MSRAARAYAHARVHAVRARLLRRADILPLYCATDRASTARALATFALDPHRDLFPQLFARLLAVYRTVIRAHAEDTAIFRALLRLHAIENVKAEWRGEVPSRNLGELDEELDVEELRPAGELALDRWGSRMLLETAAELPDDEALARELVELVVRERDNELLRRASEHFALSDAAARGMTVLLHAPVDPHVLQARRRTLCRRAFVGHTFELAPSIALILLAEDELRGVIALAERAGESSLDGAVERVLASGLMGEAA